MSHPDTAVGNQYGAYSGYCMIDTSCVNRPKTTTAVGHGEELSMYLIGFVAPDRPLDRSKWVSTLRNKMPEC